MLSTSVQDVHLKVHMSQGSPSLMVHLVAEPTSGPMLVASRNPSSLIVTVLVLSSQEHHLHHMSVIIIIVRVPITVLPQPQAVGSLTMHCGTVRTAIWEAVAVIALGLLGL